MAGQVDHWLTRRVDDVQDKLGTGLLLPGRFTIGRLESAEDRLPVDWLGLDHLAVAVDGFEGPEGAIAGFGRPAFPALTFFFIDGRLRHEVAESVDNGGLAIESGEGGEGEDAERRFIPGSERQLRGALGVAQVGQGVGRVEPHFQVGLFEPLAENQLGLGAPNRLEFEAGPPRRFGGEQRPPEPLQPFALFDNRLVDGNRPHHLQVVHEVLAVPFGDTQFDVLVGLGLGHRDLAALQHVEVPAANRVGDPLGLATPAEIAPQVEPQQAVGLLQPARVDASAGNPATLQHAWFRIAVHFTGRQQDGAFGFAEGVAGTGAAAGHHRLLGHVDLEQVPRPQAGGGRTFGNCHLDVEPLTDPDVGRDAAADHHQRLVRVFQQRVGTANPALVHFFDQHAAVERRGSVTPGSFQPIDQPDRFDLNEVQAGDRDLVANERQLLGLRLVVGDGLALAVGSGDGDRGPKQAQQQPPDQRPAQRPTQRPGLRGPTVSSGGTPGRGSGECVANVQPGSAGRQHQGTILGVGGRRAALSGTFRESSARVGRNPVNTGPRRAI